MCGIVAQIKKNSEAPDEGLIRAMAEDIHHRGPDDDGFYFGEWFGLGFKRLSILDLSQHGHQPMFDDEQRFLIVFNGELYNHKQLRDDLVARGYTFRSTSDTEVVLKSYVEWERECLQRFVGMFAFIIVDLTEDQIFVARDQLGIKPIYLYQDNDTILFASEIKCFRHHIRFAVNEEALYEQFVYNYVSGERTLFRDVHRLLPGSWMLIGRNGHVREGTYYSVTDSLVGSPHDPVELKRVERDLQEAIYAHTQSDVGYNVQFSGGLDSSYVTAVLSQEYGEDLHTYSISMRGSPGDESPYQEKISGLLGTTHHDFPFDGMAYADAFFRATWHMDIPIVHTGCVLLMLLCQEAQERSKVMITGEGADELFGGYHWYSISRARRLAFSLKRRGLRAPMVPGFGRLGTLKGLLSEDLGMDDVSCYKHSRPLGLFNLPGRDIEYRREVADSHDSLLKTIIAVDQTIHLGSVLERQDKMSMAASVESRVPFCVHHLFDLVNSFDPDLKIDPATKIILRRLSRRYFDREFKERRKQGILLPIGDWIRERKALGRFLDLLTDDTFRGRGYCDPTGVQRRIDGFLRGEQNGLDESLIWGLLRFEVWHRVFIDGDGLSD